MKVGDMEMKFADFLSYSKATNDEMPLYLFDKTFAKKAPQLQHDFQVCPDPLLSKHSVLLSLLRSSACNVIAADS